MKPLKIFLAILSVAFVALSCEKDKRVPPDLSFRTGTRFISRDTTVGKDTAVVVGVIAQMTEDYLKRFSVSHAYDNNATTTTDTTIALDNSANAHYETFYPIQTRNQAGTEKWVFTITDINGNTAQKQIVLTVQ
jgi:hypothetical protein